MAESKATENTQGNQVLLHDKVAALRKEREGQSRTPTPPPNLYPMAGDGRLRNTSPTDLLHKKTKKKLEATAWSQQNSPSFSPRTSNDGGARKSQLSPLASQYGQMSSMEKKTLDRTIHSLLQ